MNCKARLFGLVLCTFSGFSCAAPAPASDPSFTHGVSMLGEGGQTCTEYNHNRTKSLAHVMDMQWLAGFISSYSLIHDIQYTALSSDDFYNRFDAYCNKPDFANTPITNVAYAMMFDLDKELGVPGNFSDDIKAMDKEMKSDAQ